MLVDGLGCNTNVVCKKTEVVKGNQLLGIRIDGSGIYLFEDELSLSAYLEGPLAAAVMAHPALSELNAKVFDSIEEITRITRGPIETVGSV